MKVACRREMAANFIKNRILEPKENLKMKDEEIGIVRKIELEKNIYKRGFEKSFSKTKLMEQ